jgi:hypothetical protein
LIYINLCNCRHFGLFYRWVRQSRGCLMDTIRIVGNAHTVRAVQRWLVNEDEAPVRFAMRRMAGAAEPSQAPDAIDRGKSRDSAERRVE